MAGHTIKPLTLDTWDAFAALVEKHNGVWGGCWDSWFHESTPEADKSLGGPAFKRRMVELGRARASLVFDGDAAIGWCQYGALADVPRINHVKEWNAGLKEKPDYRIVCFFIDRDHRREGVAAEALDGALDLIVADGGGLVEAYPHDMTKVKKFTPSFVHNGTVPMFERVGFSLERSLGTQRTVMRKRVRAA